jgi:hypothetical protein
MSEYRIFDWAGNLRFPDRDFETFEDGESFLAEYLGDDYETDRQEYYITEWIRKEPNDRCNAGL